MRKITAKILTLMVTAALVMSFAAIPALAYKTQNYPSWLWYVDSETNSSVAESARPYYRADNYTATEEAGGMGRALSLADFKTRYAAVDKDSKVTFTFEDTIAWFGAPSATDTTNWINKVNTYFEDENIRLTIDKTASGAENNRRTPWVVVTESTNLEESSSGTNAMSLACGGSGLGDVQTFTFESIAAKNSATGEYDVETNKKVTSTGFIIISRGGTDPFAANAYSVTANFAVNGSNVGSKTLSVPAIAQCSPGTNGRVFFGFDAPKGAYISDIVINMPLGQWPRLDDFAIITEDVTAEDSVTASISISGSDKIKLSADASVSENYEVTVKAENGTLVDPDPTWSLVGEYNGTASITNSGVLTLTKEFSGTSVTIKAEQDGVSQTKTIVVEPAANYLNPVKMEGSLTEYDMESFKADLEEADARAIMTFEDGSYSSAKEVLIPTDVYDQDQFGPSAKGGLSMPIVYKNGTEDENVRFNLYYSNKQGNITKASDRINEDNTLSVSGTKFINMWTKGFDSNLFFGCEKSGEDYAATVHSSGYTNLKPTAIGFSMRHTAWSSPMVVKATITNGITDETVTVLDLASPTPDSKAMFVGIKAPEGKFIRYITFNTTNSLSVDDVCFALNARPAEYDKLIPSYESLEIHENNLTDYIPLDGYGSADDVKIRWKSSDETVVTNTGKIYPKVGEEQTVTLTATLYIDGSDVTLDKEFTVTIPAVKPYVIEGVKVTGADGLTDTELVAGKEISKVSVKRYDTANSKIVVAVALYDADEKLEDISFEVVTPSVSAYTHGDITLANPVKIPSGDITGYTAKAMIWSETGLVPLADSYSVAPFDNKVTVYMLGDSLSQSGGVTSYPYNGWGDTVENYFLSENVTVDNSQSEGGVSTKMVVSGKKKLPYVEEKIGEGDYIFVMLGHNDQTFGNGENYRHTGIGEFNQAIDGDNISYYGYLMHIVDVARENKANLVFFTPFNRAYDSLDNLRGMNLAMKAFANEQNLPVLDTAQLSLDLYNKLLEKGTELKNEGKVSSAEDFARNIFLFVKENDPRYPDMTAASSYFGKNTADFTHFNIYGADLRAQLAVLALSDSANALGRFENVASESYEALYTKAINDILATEYYGKIN
ncbi:MAG: hypothetical protein IKB93_05920 [Clostridia bacterium]|nr:hypothetical protein [Clostridia bacterium]